MKVHVCLVSDQPIPNLTTVLQFKPDIVILLKTRDMKEKAGFLEEVLKKKKFTVHSETIEAYDINNVIRVSEGLINKYSDQEISLNITGGTKITALGAYQVFYTSNKPIFYVDTKDNKILKLFPEKEELAIPIEVSVSIADYLAVYGFQINSYVEDDEYIFKRKDLTNYLASTVAVRPHIIPSINSELHKFNDKSPMPISVKMPKDDKLLQLITILPKVSLLEEDKITISDRSSLMYLKGFWLEEYVYMAAKDLKPDEIKLNVTGRWVTKGQHPPKNEFDVMLSKGNRLFYISCKTANPNRKVQNDDEGMSKDFLYELVSLSDRALGLFGKRMLVISRQISNPAIRERTKILKVDLIEGRNIISLKDNLRQWLNS